MSAAENQSIPVLVTGALGRMGAEVIRAVHSSADCHLVGAVDTTPGKEGADIGELIGLGPIEIAVTADLEGCLCATSQAVRDAGPQKGAVMVDFTHPSVVYANTRAAIAYGVHPVIGTTGLSPEQLKDLQSFSEKASVGGAVIPIFLWEWCCSSRPRLPQHVFITMQSSLSFTTTARLMLPVEPASKLQS